MSEPTFRFDDGAGYEQFMGKWSRMVGAQFIDWLAPQSGLRWLDVGCGNGAFTDMIFERCAPASVHGIDPSEEQLAFARTRPASLSAQFRQADAMALPFADNAFDAAVMPLVIFFVPEPAVGVAEMARVVRPGGSISAYAWDMLDAGFPYEDWLGEMKTMGIAVPMPPSVEASRLDALRDLWAGAGLVAIETRAITVQRTFADFDDYWATLMKGPNVGPRLATMTPTDIEHLEKRLRARLTPDATGRITLNARANAVSGRVPA
ncbi:MAG: class I SAM-dependent methyltransferase [Pseudomonadota bacterium]